jgi:hypothetical protein
MMTCARSLSNVVHASDIRAFSEPNQANATMRLIFEIEGHKAPDIISKRERYNLCH